MLYLLHGLSDDDTIWSRRTSIERYVAPLGIAVVMPQVHQSFYADEVHGLPFWTFLTEELPDARARVLPHVDRARGHLRGRAVDGRVRSDEVGPARAAPVRRGGQPVRRPRPVRPARRRGPLVPGTCWTGSSATSPSRAAATTSGTSCAPRIRPRCPRLYVACGTEDFLYGESLAFIEDARGGRRRTDDEHRRRRPRVGLLGPRHPGRAGVAAAAHGLTRPRTPVRPPAEAGGLGCSGREIRLPG